LGQSIFNDDFSIEPFPRTADSEGLGFAGGTILFSVLLALVASAYFWTRVSRTLLFWCAFILTRPLGAVVGDLPDKPVEAGGFEISRYAASGVLAALMIACIILIPQRPAWPNPDRPAP
jgi:uncharacterized membrane-anchored protein